MVKNILSAAVAIMLMNYTASVSASAYEQPYGICLSIETKELSISDIPENREVSVGIYLDNAPPFEAISFMVKKIPERNLRK